MLELVEERLKLWVGALEEQFEARERASPVLRVGVGYQPGQQVDDAVAGDRCADEQLYGFNVVPVQLGGVGSGGFQ